MNKGRGWANVKNINLKVQTGKALTFLSNSSVDLFREDGKNTITSVRNSTKVALLDADDNNNLNELYVPVQNEITVIDSAITSAYSKIKLTKLKKEIKMTYLESDLLSESDWYKSNLASDFNLIDRTGLEDEYAKIRFSQATSTLKNSLNLFTFNLTKIQENHLKRIQDLYKNAFYFASL